MAALPISAQLYNPSGIAVDSAGKVYVSDSSNGRIRVLVAPLPPLSGPTISLVANSLGHPVQPGMILLLDATLT